MDFRRYLKECANRMSTDTSKKVLKYQSKRSKSEISETREELCFSILHGQNNEKDDDSYFITSNY
jgi:hypothetical protein